MTRRDFMEIDPARQRLIRFIKAAQQGRYYNPMDSVGREAAIEAASLVLGEDSLLGALAKEVKELRDVVTSRRPDAKLKRRNKVRTALGKTNRSALWPIAQELGLNPMLWGRFLSTAVTSDMKGEMEDWSLDDWTNYLRAKAPEMVSSSEERKTSNSEDIPLARAIPEETLDAVANALPSQPSPQGIHRDIVTTLDLPTKTVTAAIQELIRRGRFNHQVDGVVLENEIIATISQDN